MNIKNIFIILAVCLITSTTYAQGDKPRGRNLDKTAENELRKKQVEDLNNRELVLHSLDLNRNEPNTREEAQKLKREEIANNLRQLMENNEKLNSLTVVLDERRLKDAANLANKLANASKDLRRSLELKGKKDSNNSQEMPLSNEEKMAEIKELSAKLNHLVEQVIKAQSIGSVDASLIEKTQENLNEIELSASRLKFIAGKK